MVRQGKKLTGVMGKKASKHGSEIDKGLKVKRRKTKDCDIRKRKGMFRYYKVGSCHDNKGKRWKNRKL